jgi:hypothetical protein
MEIGLIWLRQEAVWASCQNDNQPSDFIQGEEFFIKWMAIRFLKTLYIDFIIIIIIIIIIVTVV